MKNYNSFMIAVSTNFGKNIAFYLPCKFEELNYWKYTEK